MTKKRSSVIDPDLAKVGAALRRAAAKALERGIQTNTPVWVMRDGKLVDLVAERQRATPSRDSKAKIPKRNTKRNIKNLKIKK